MSKFEEMLASIRNEITSMLKPEMEEKQIQEIKGISDKVEELGKAHQELADENLRLKDAYIKSIQTTGSKEKPDENDHSGEPKPKSLLELAQELKAKEKETK